MNTFTIIGQSLGSPHDTQNTLAHFYQQTLATGARMAQGDGTGLGLVVWSNAIGIVNAGGFTAKFETAATANRTMTVPDKSGTIVLGDGTGITDAAAFREAVSAERTIVLGADFTTTSDTAQAVPSFALSLEVDSLYHLKAVLRVSSGAVNVGVRPSLTGPSGSLDYLTAIARRGSEDLMIDAFDQQADFLNSEAIDTAEIMTIEGMISINSTAPGSSLGLAIQSETNGSIVRVLAGSFFNLRKVN